MEMLQVDFAPGLVETGMPRELTAFEIDEVAGGIAVTTVVAAAVVTAAAAVVAAAAAWYSALNEC